MRKPSSYLNSRHRPCDPHAGAESATQIARGAGTRRKEGAMTPRSGRIRLMGCALGVLVASIGVVDSRSAIAPAQQPRGTPPGPPTVTPALLPVSTHKAAPSPASTPGVSAQHRALL